MRAAMVTAAVVACVGAARPGRGLGADAQWVLETSTLTYHVSHPFHHVDGTSRAARGKGVCHDGECDFLVAAPVESFTSGDSNRDLHMLQAVRGAEYPMVTVRFQLPEQDLSARTIHADIEIQFAGQTAEYKQLAFQETAHGSEVTVTGTIPVTLADFKIDPPSLLAIPVKNEVPIAVEMRWRRQ
jgi:YceI-like domain